MIKKLLCLLVLLLTATTGAWAQGPVDGTIAWSEGHEASATVSASIKDAISSTGVTTGSGLNVSTNNYFDTYMVSYRPTTANAGNVEGVMIEYTIEAVDGYKFKPTGVDYAAVKVGTDNASYSWSYTIDGVESAITDVSMNDVLRNTGSNSGTAQLMHNESITADGCSVFTLRFYISNCGTSKNICIGNITISGSVSAAAASTYSVTLAEGTEDADKWTIEPNAGLKGGETVTATYSGTKKVKSVKAVKKAAAAAYTLLSAAATSDVGKVVCAAGHLHDAKTAVPDGCTAVGILGKVTATGHGLILALKDAPEQEWVTVNGWASETSYAGTTLKVLPNDAARGTNLTSYTTLGETAVSNWAVAQKSDYEAIFQNLGSTTNVGGGYTCDGNVNAYITTGVGGAAISFGCWSATEYDNAEAWYFYNEYWSQDSKDDENRRVRPVLGF